MIASENRTHSNITKEVWEEWKKYFSLTYPNSQFYVDEENQIILIDTEVKKIALGIFFIVRYLRRKRKNIRKRK